MRHRKIGRKLGRNSSHRKAMFSNMAASLMRYELIKTTLPKAKELRRVVEPLITKAKTDSVANRRYAFAKLRDKAIVKKLFTELGPRYTTRPGGYLRILKCGFRVGDKAPMAIVELVGRPMISLDDINFDDDLSTDIVADDAVEQSAAKTDETKADSSNQSKSKDAEKAEPSQPAA